MKTRLAGGAVAGIVTAATLVYALWGIDLAALGATLSAGNLWVVPPFLLVLGVFYYTNAVRWRLLLVSFGRFQTAELLPSMMIGFAANNVLPLRVGEVIRAYLLGKDLQVSRSGVLMNLALERLLDLIAILTIFFVGLLLLPEAPQSFRTTAWLALGATTVLAAALALFVAMPEQIERAWRYLAQPLAASIGERGSIYVAQFAKGLAPMRDARAAALLIGQSIGRWLLSVMLAWLAVYAFAGSVSLSAAMVTLGITAFAVSLPSTPGFVGPMQAAFVLALTPLGIDQEAALAASLLFLLGHWIPVTAAGALLLAARHSSFREIAAKAALPDG
jgi:uncharacterized protein (TIRG00374 family)